MKRLNQTIIGSLGGVLAGLLLVVASTSTVLSEDLATPATATRDGALVSPVELTPMGGGGGFDLSGDPSTLTTNPPFFKSPDELLQNDIVKGSMDAANKFFGTLGPAAAPTSSPVVTYGLSYKAMSHYFQPTPIYYHAWKFSLPMGSGGKPHWSSDTSQTFCSDGHITGAANGAGVDLKPDCNNYTDAMQDGSEAGTATLMGQVDPHQMIFAPGLYYPLCNLGLGYAPVTPSDNIRAGWDFTVSDGYNYTGCYGFTSALVVPGIDEKTGNATELYSGHPESDLHRDLIENVPPNLDSPWGKLDPVDLAFEDNQIHVNNNGGTPISVTMGQFYHPLALGKMGGSGGVHGTPTITNLLGIGGTDIAVLKRKDSGSGVTGSIQIIEGRAGGAARQCATKAFASTCAACTDPFNLDFATFSANCAPCVSSSSSPTSVALNKCEKIQSLSDADASPDIALDDTSDPVYIATIPFGNLPISMPEVGLTGFGSDLVVLNRGPVNCYALDQTYPSIRFRNPKLESATGNYTDTNSDTFVDMHDGDAVKIMKEGVDSGTSIPMSSGADADKCGYLTFYHLSPGGGTLPPKVEVVKYTAANGDKQTVKIPVGFNPTSLGIGDYNMDGQVDFLVANTGSQKEDIDGSLSIVFCSGLTASQDPTNGHPASGEFFHHPLCAEGYTVRDIYLKGDNGTSFKAFHPWWTVSTVFKGHMADWIDASKPAIGHDGNPEPIAFPFGTLIIQPSDAAFTMIDSWKDDAHSQIGVFINKIDDKFTSLGLTPTYKWWTDVDFAQQALDVPPTIAKKLATGLGLYPLGIATTFTKHSTYNPMLFGLDVFIGTLSSEILKGFPMNFSGSSFYQTLSDCPSLYVGFNNSHFACEARSDVTPISKNFGICTGNFGFNDLNCAETTTPVYNNDGNWGPTYLASTLLNSQTERGMRQDASGLFFYNRFWNLNPNPNPLFIGNIDLQLDFSPDLGVLNGTPLKIPEHSINASGVAGYDLPNDNCHSKAFEVSTLLADTTDKGDCFHYSDTNGNGQIDSGDLPVDPTTNKPVPALEICAGQDPITPQRCWQRYGGNLIASACCLMLETPGDPAFTSKLPAPGVTCPLGDPIQCCVMQNMANSLAHGYPSIDWTKYPASDPVVTNAVYDTPSSAPACMCGDKLAKWQSYIGLPPSPAAFAAYKDYFCCLNPGDTACKSTPPPDPCASWPASLQTCCTSHGASGCPSPSVDCNSNPPVPASMKACCQAGWTGPSCPGGGTPPPPTTACTDKDGNPLTGSMLACCQAGWTGSSCPADCSSAPIPVSMQKCCAESWSGPDCPSGTPTPPGGHGPVCTDPAWGTLSHCCTDHDMNGNGVIDAGAELMAVFADPTCVPPSTTGEGCSNVLNINITGSTNVTVCGIQQCCQAVSHPGAVINSAIIQTCTNSSCGPTDPCASAASMGIDPPPSCNPACKDNPSQPGCTPTTTPEGLVAATCECAPANPKDQVGKYTFSETAAGRSTPFTCQYTAPSTSGPLALTSANVLSVKIPDGSYTVLDPGDPASAGKDMASVSLPPTSNTFTVFAPPLKSYSDNPDYPKGTIDVAAIALDGTVTSSAKCDVVAKIGVQGGGMGCALTDREGDDAAGGALPQVIATASVLTALALLRRRSVRQIIKRPIKK